MGRVLILGVGNRLIGDEGFGSYFADALSRFDLPPGVRAFDGGTGGMALLHEAEGEDLVVIVDAVSERYGPPGSVVRLSVDKAAFSPEEVAEVMGEIDLHQFGPEMLVALGSVMGVFSGDVCVIGVVPSRLDLGMGLSPEVERAALGVLEKLREVLRERGIELGVDPDDFLAALRESYGIPKFGGT